MFPDAIARIREPDGMIFSMDNDIVGRVKSFSLISICDYLYRSVMFMSDDLAGTMLAGEKPTDVVKSISISIAARFFEYCDSLIIFNPAVHGISRYITENQIASDRVPYATLMPQSFWVEIESLDGCVAKLIAIKSLIQGYDSWIGITSRFSP